MSLLQTKIPDDAESSFTLCRVYFISCMTNNFWGTPIHVTLSQVLTVLFFHPHLDAAQMKLSSFTVKSLSFSLSICWRRTGGKHTWMFLHQVFVGNTRMKPQDCFMCGIRNWESWRYFKDWKCFKSPLSMNQLSKPPQRWLCHCQHTTSLLPQTSLPPPQDRFLTLAQVPVIRVTFYLPQA